MIIWSGAGFLVGIVAVACLVVTQLCVNGLLHDDHFYQEHGWPKLLALAISALVVWPLGLVLNRDNGREFVDTKTGERFRLANPHTFFFIPVQYWGPILLVLGIVFLFVGTGPERGPSGTPPLPNEKGKERLVEAPRLGPDDLARLSEDVRDHHDKKGYRSLSAPEQVFYCVWMFQDGLTKGDFRDYYLSSAGDRARDAVLGLRTIGARRTADVLHEANQLLGPLGPSQYPDGRQKQLDALSATASKRLAELKKEFMRGEEKIDSLLATYAAENYAAFRNR